MFRINEWEEAKRRGNKGYVYTSPFRWDSSTGMDHWCHATVYWRIGMNRFGMSKGMMFSEEPLKFEKGVEINVRRETELNPKEAFSFPQDEEDWRLR